MNLDSAIKKYNNIKAPDELYQKTLNRIEGENRKKTQFSVVRFASLAAACVCIIAAVTLTLVNGSSSVTLTDKTCSAETLDFVPVAQTAAFGMRSLSVTEGALLPIELESDCKVEFEKGRFASRVGNNPPAEIVSGTTVTKGSSLYIVFDGENEYNVKLTADKKEYELIISVENKGKIRLSLKK